MPLIEYIQKNLRPKTLNLVNTAVEIIQEYAAQGFELTLRQLYYQFVARNILANTEKSYKLLGDAISDGRLCGMIDWEAIVDRTRFVRENSHWDGPSDIVETCVRQFQIDKWSNQEARCIVLIEKDALVGVIENVCRDLDVPCLSCRGYTSQTEMWKLGQRLVSWVDERKGINVFHLGDHDPSGIDMSRDIEDRLYIFLDHHHPHTPINFKRLALNMSQVEQYSPPPNPAKITDSRANKYISQYGDESWELDALEPRVLAGLVRNSVIEVRDDNLWREMLTKEEGFKAMLAKSATALKKKEKKK